MGIVYVFLFVSTPSTRINAQSLQLEMWFIFNLKKTKINRHFNSTMVMVRAMLFINNTMKATYLCNMLRTGVDKSPTSPEM